MQHARNTPSLTTLPTTPPNGLTRGIDWARDDHAVSIFDSAGREAHRFTVEHTEAGLRNLIHRMSKLGVGEVAIERPDGPVVEALLAASLTVVVISPNQLKNLRSRYGSADAHSRTSLPHSGTVRLLAEIGDCRARFPTPESLACLAGVAPSTRQSGKSRSVGFRWACDKQLRDAVCDFAGDSRRANPWADQLYRQAINRGHDHPHAVRILARAWLSIIWHCWQNGTAYQPTQHEALQRLLAGTPAPAEAA